MLRYLEGRVLQLEGRNSDAVSVFDQLRQEDGRSDLVLLRLAETLRRGGAGAKAAEVLREAVAQKGPHWAEVWKLWFSLCSGDLGVSNEKIFLEPYVEDPIVRINCGGTAGLKLKRDAARSQIFVEPPLRFCLERQFRDSTGSIEPQSRGPSVHRKPLS